MASYIGPEDLGEGIFKNGPLFFTEVPTRAVCDFFKLEDNYRAIASHKTVENLVDSVYFNEK